MQSNIFKATNEGKGLILLPHDNGEHPIVGACISPRENALDTIQLPGSTLPNWVTDARTAANYDSTLDTALPPGISHVNTETFTLHPYEVQAFGGYNLKVNGVVCPMHFTQGILRNGGKCLQKLKQRTVTVDTYEITKDNFVMSAYMRSNVQQNGTRPVTSSACTYASLYLFPSADAYSFGYTELIPLDPKIGTQLPTGFKVVTIPATSGPQVAPTAHTFDNYVMYDWYTSGGRRYQNYSYVVTQDRVTHNISSTSIIPKRSVYVDDNVRYNYRYDVKIYISIYHFTDEYEDISTSKSTYISDAKLKPNKATLLYMNKGTINTGVDYGTVGTQVGRTVYSDVIERDTTKGFMVGTNKAMVVTNELRRNFLRISPTVFNHKGDF